MEETKLYKLLNLAEVDKLFSAYQKNGMLMDGSIEDLRSAPNYTNNYTKYQVTEWVIKVVSWRCC